MIMANVAKLALFQLSQQNTETIGLLMRVAKWAKCLSTIMLVQFILFVLNLFSKGYREKHLDYLAKALKMPILRALF